MATVMKASPVRWQSTRSWMALVVYILMFASVENVELRHCQQSAQYKREGDNLLAKHSLSTKDKDITVIRHDSINDASAIH
jgi:hypothetical protein